MNLLRDPFFHFLALGALIYGGVALFHAWDEPRRILVGQQQVQRLATTYAEQFGRPPSAAELKALVNAYIDEEIFYREGLALKLDQDDEIVRRRIAQKFTFLQQGLAVVGEPSEAQLSAYFETHRDRYLTPAEVSFTHIYFSPDQGGTDAAEARAEGALQGLRAANPDRSPNSGDPFPDLYDYASMSKAELDRLFGDSGFAEHVLAAPVGVWSGPFRSGYGWHVVRVSEKAKPAVPSFERVKDKVRADYVEEMQARKNAAAIQALRRKYEIVDDEDSRG